MQSRDKLDNMAVAAPSRATAFRLGCAFGILSVFLPAPVLFAQTAPAAPDAPTPTAQKAPEKKPPSAAEQFPYPGGSTPPANPTPQTGTLPSSTPAPAPAANTTKQFPYPGETPVPDPGSASSSSSSSSSGDAGPDSIPDSDNPPATPGPKQAARRKLAKPKNLQTDEEREAEDLNVARFYRDRGNWPAAYLRSKDAVQHQPDDPDAHLLLAETAEKLNKRDEAIAEYKATLKLDASDKQIKSVRKALAQLQ